MPQLEHVSATPEAILKPYLTATLSLTTRSSDSPIEPLFTVYYIQHLSLPSTPSSSFAPDLPSSILVTPPPSVLLPEASDSAAQNAEAVFRAATHTLKSMHPTLEDEDLDEQEIEPFWPSIEADTEEAEEW
jgi:hypothetical protein